VIGDVFTIHDRGLEPAGRDVEPGDAHRNRAVVAAGERPRQEGDEPVAANGVEERLVGGDARGDDPRHLPAEQPLGRLAIRRSRPIYLFADGDVAACGHEPHEMGVELMVREARHRQGVGALVATGEREVEEAGRLAGVGAEELVEVAHPEEDQRPRTPGLRRLELLHHRGRHGRKCSSL
jgi:hypothetical protein